MLDRAPTTQPAQPPRRDGAPHLRVLTHSLTRAAWLRCARSLLADAAAAAATPSSAPSAGGSASGEEAASSGAGGGEAADAPEEKEETCGFCKFMKAGPCGEVFAAWEACVDKHRDAGDDFVETCLPQTRGLKECMEANPEYYGPLLGGDEEEGEGAEGAEGEGEGEAAAAKAADAAEAADAAPAAARKA
jgi:hypothetical protein